jgi:hypothetical protein
VWNGDAPRLSDLRTRERCKWVTLAQACRTAQQKPCAVMRLACRAVNKRHIHFLVHRAGRGGLVTPPLPPPNANEQLRQRATRASIRSTKALMRLRPFIDSILQWFLRNPATRARHRSDTAIRVVALNDPGSSRHVACPLPTPPAELLGPARPPHAQCIRQADMLPA